MSELIIRTDEHDKTSLRGKVITTLRQDILSGKYKENDEIKEMVVSSRMGVSRTPVREAIRQLELEGLVKIIPNRGAFVVGISPKDILDIYEIRSVLEGLCAKWATRYITQEQIEELEEIIYLSEFQVSKGKYSQVYENDNRFHEVLYLASHSTRLEHTLQLYHHYVQRVRKSALSNQMRAELAVKEHKAILEAIKSGNAQQAEMLAMQHIKNAEGFLNLTTETVV